MFLDRRRKPEETRAVMGGIFRLHNFNHSDTVKPAETSRHTNVAVMHIKYGAAVLLILLTLIPSLSTLH